MLYQKEVAMWWMLMMVVVHLIVFSFFFYKARRTGAFSDTLSAVGFLFALIMWTMALLES